MGHLNSPSNLLCGAIERVWRWGAVQRLVVACGFILLFAGCQFSDTPEFRFNSVEWLKQERLTLDEGDQLDPAYRDEIELMMFVLFGTPDEPRLPNLAILATDSADQAVGIPSDAGTPGPKRFDLEKLKHAAGAVNSDQQGVAFGLYREHCAHCHGVTGDGAGSTAGFLDPYPRDFRLGKFKFKSTPLRQAPTHQDLLDIINNGIPGTAMPAFWRLHDVEVDILADYVRYLSVRGQVERYLIDEATLKSKERFLSQSYPRPWSELAEPQLAEIEKRAIDIIGEDVLEEWFNRWMIAEQRVTPVPPPPGEMDSTGNLDSEWVSQGRELFFGKGNCAQCHVEKLAQDNSIYFDDWTSDWITNTGVDVHSKQSYRDFVKAGALPPRPVRPRNLRLPVKRGGASDEMIYRQIANGIEGTPMPSNAATMTPEEIWALVAFVRTQLAAEEPQP